MVCPMDKWLAFGVDTQPASKNTSATANICRGQTASRHLIARMIAARMHYVILQYRKSLPRQPCVAS